jgi:hypothetical protein
MNLKTLTTDKNRSGFDLLCRKIRLNCGDHTKADSTAQPLEGLGGKLTPVQSLSHLVKGCDE